MLWSHMPVAPWQTLAWLEQMRGRSGRPAYVRMIENRFVTTESTQWLPDVPSKSVRFASATASGTRRRGHRCLPA